MAGLDPSFPVKKPISVWNQPLKADFKGLFSALARGAIHGFTGQWAELGSDAADGLSSLGIDSRDAPQLAWLLLRRALLYAMGELIREAAPTAGEPKKSLEKLSTQLDNMIGKEEVSIDRSLFERPRDLPLLLKLREPFVQWLEAYGLDRSAAESIARRLPSYFVVALHSEWRRKPTDYGPVLEAVETPFIGAAERERAWDLYTARLDRQVDEPMFGEAFGLRQVYVPLRAFYRVDYSGDKTDRLARKRDLASLQAKEQMVAVDLASEIIKWIESEDQRDGYRVISGGPGSGKSSFARMCAAQIAREGHIPILFIPLHQLNVSGALVDSVGEYVNLADILPFNPLNPETGEDRLLIFFDGLDELSLQGRVGSDAARDFVREVLKIVEIRNQSRRRLLVLFTGREPVVQASESEFRDRHRIFHVLPYLVEDSLLERSLWKSGWELLGKDSRQSWWRLYGEVSGRGYSGLPEELNRSDLAEITTQPLFNYLVALSYSRGRLTLSQHLNLNDIYEDLLEAVHERAYEQKRPHAAIQGLSLPEFRRILEEIALAAWHGNGRTTSVGEIEAHCEAAGLSGLLKRFAEGARAGVTRVLTAFYFRQFGRTVGGDPTFEFTHKSFREYLTALRIVRALEIIGEETERRRTSFDKGWDEREALRHWADTCGLSRMDHELWVFVYREIQRKGRATAERWQKLLCGLIASMLRNGMPMELLSPRPSYAEETRRSTNAEEALLVVLNACAQTTGEFSRIEWPETEGGQAGSAAFGAWIKKLQAQRISVANLLALECLSLLDLSDCVLNFIDWNRANLEKVNLERATLEGANMEQAHLEGANLRGASLVRARLNSAHLELADLRGANLKGVNMEGASLYTARLERAHLEDAHLNGSNLLGAQLEGAYLVGANLEQARMVEANLREANLERANLKGAHLERANLSNALLSSKQLSETFGKPVGKPRLTD